MSKNFKDSEMACDCCGEVKLDPHLFAILELVRLRFDSPVVITSGYRCPKHNESVGGASNSQHLLGTASDIVLKGVAPKDVYDFIDGIFPKTYGLGLYDTFVHIDVRQERARW